MFYAVQNGAGGVVALGPFPPAPRTHYSLVRHDVVIPFIGSFQVIDSLPSPVSLSGITGVLFCVTVRVVQGADQFFDFPSYTLGGTYSFRLEPGGIDLGSGSFSSALLGFGTAEIYQSWVVLSAAGGDFRPLNMSGTATSVVVSGETAHNLKTGLPGASAFLDYAIVLMRSV